jgi:NAD-dependent SIR2 family protein deacetylase
MPATVEAPVTLRCTSCGDTFTLSARRAREWRNREPLCRRCQTPARELTDAERARYRRWWLDRLPRDELEDLARSIWPESSDLDDASRRA